MSHFVVAPDLERPRSVSFDRSVPAGIWQNGLVAAAFLLLWLQVVNHLWAERTVNPQFCYGWIVPFLALFLFYGRWQDKPVPEPLAAALLLWLGLCEICAAGWYHAREARSSQESSWSVSWPVNQTGYAEAKIPEATRELLLYNEGGGANWTGGDSHLWMMYYFRWLPGRTAARFVKVHRPDICLPASGLTMVSDNGIQLMKINGINLPIRSYRFQNGGVPLHVFYCYWDSRSSYETTAAANEEDWTARGRLRAAWNGRREAGAQMLEVVVSGYDDDAAAATALQRQLEQIIRRS
jgi:Protein of unknown function (DUF3485)